MNAWFVIGCIAGLVILSVAGAVIWLVRTVLRVIRGGV